MTRQRLIAHIDMDAFYASVELLRYSDLVGRPVVIGGGSRHKPVDAIDPATGETIRHYSTLGGYVGRGVITTATYEARALGLHSAMGMMKASQLAPEAVLLPVDFDQYRKYSRLFKAAVREIAPEIEDRGIDEIYADLTDVVDPMRDPWDAAREIAAGIKRAVREVTGLNCSIGVTPNKLLSKIASDLDKPDGLTILKDDDVAGRIWPLSPRKINGIGPKATAKLTGLGIATIGTLAQTEPRYLVSQFGKSFGTWMHEAANGRDDRPVVTFSEPKSISRETTFERDLHPVRDREALSQIFTELCEALAGDLRRKGYVGKTIGLKLRFDNFQTVTRDRTLKAPTQEAWAIRRTASECLKSVNLDRKLRLLGVRISSLEPSAQVKNATSPGLFE